MGHEGSMYKICRECGCRKLTTDFYKDTRASDGLRCYCKECCQARDRKRRALNGNAIRAKKRARYKDNKERINQECREFYAKNREKCLAASKVWAEKNKDKIRLHSQNRRVRESSQRGRIPKDYWQFMISVYGDKCMNPSCQYPQTKNNYLTLDHVVPLIKGGLHDISNFQILCKSCNSSKSDKIIDHRSFVLYDEE